MSRFFMYLPFDDKNMVNPAYSFTDRMEHLGLCDEAFVIGEAYLSEANVKKHEPIFIAGHCGPGIDYIADTKGGMLTAKDVAKQFDGKLGKDHREIRVWACYAGEGMTEKKGLAYKFWQEMHLLGFNDLTVYGYRLVVLDPFERSQEKLIAAEALPGFKSLMETPEKLKELPGNAHHWMTGIAPDGTVIPPKPLPRPH